MTPERPAEREAGIRPFPSLWRAADAAGRRAFPFVFTAAVLLALAFPVGLPGQPELQKAWLLASVYFWAVYRPGSMTPLAACALGVLSDLLGPAPFGIDMLVLLALDGAATRARLPLIRQGFLVVWLAFVGFAALASVAEWALTATLTLSLLPFSPSLFLFGLAAGFYPVLAVMLIRAHGNLAAPERA